MSKRRRLDRETLELFSDEPELLAIADAIKATDPLEDGDSAHLKQYRRLRVTALVVSPLAAIAAAVALVLMLHGTSSPTLLHQARAAIDRGPALVVVLRQRVPNASLVDLRTGRSRPIIAELLSARDAGSTSTAVMRQNGRVAWTFVREPGVRAEDDIPARLAVFAREYRASLDNGSAEVVSMHPPMLKLDDGTRVRLSQALKLPVLVVRDGSSWTVSTIRQSAHFRLRSSTEWQLTEGALHRLAHVRLNPRGGDLVPLDEVERATKLSLRGRLGSSLQARKQSIVVDPTAGARDEGFRLDYRRRGGMTTLLLSLNPLDAYGFPAARSITSGRIPAAPQAAVAHQDGRWIAQFTLEDVYITVVSPSRRDVVAAARAIASTSP